MLTDRIDAVLDRACATLTGAPRPARSAEPAALAAALVLAFVAFGFELANSTLGIDDFAHLDMPFAWDPFWIGRGIWGGLLVQYLTPGGWITPFVSLAIGILLQLAAAVALGWALGVRDAPAVRLALLYALFATFPYFACQMAFSYMQIVYPLASLLAVCAVLLAQAGGWRRALCGVLAAAFAASLYQGSLSVLATVGLLAPLAHGTEPSPALVRRYARVAAVTLAGGALYLAAHKAMLRVAGVVATNPYYTVDVDWRFWERWTWIHREVRYLLLGAGGVLPVKAVALFLLAALAWLLFGYWRRQSAGERLRSLALRGALAPAAAFAPFVMMFVHFGELAPRSSVGVAVVWFALFAALLRSDPARVRSAATVALAIVVAMFVFHDNRMFFSQHLVTQADSLMMARIAERIDQLPLDGGAGPTPVVVIGGYSHPPYEGMPHYEGDVLGYSEFEWEPADTRWAMRGLARSIGVDHYAWHDADELGGAFRDPALVAGRQPWPHRSAVFAHDGYAVVWLGRRREEPRVAAFDRWLGSLLGSRR